MPPIDYRLRCDRVGEDLDYLEVSSGSTSLPTVILMHGHGSNKERHLLTLYRYAARGFRAIGFDMRSHGQRKGSQTRDVDFYRNPAATMIEIVYGSVTDLSILMDELDIKAAGVHGSSLGGITLFEAMCVEPRIQVAISVMGSPNRALLARTVGIPGDNPDLQAALATSPHRRIRDIYPHRPLLMIHGSLDTLVSAQGVTELYDDLKELYAGCPEKLKLEIHPDVGHESTEPMIVSALDWVEKFREDLLI